MQSVQVDSVREVCSVTMISLMVIVVDLCIYHINSLFTQYSYDLCYTDRDVDCDILYCSLLLNCILNLFEYLGISQNVHCLSHTWLDVTCPRMFTFICVVLLQYCVLYKYTCMHKYVGQFVNLHTRMYAIRSNTHMARCHMPPWCRFTCVCYSYCTVCCTNT